jgi:hypothetical protein
VTGGGSFDEWRAEVEPSAGLISYREGGRRWSVTGGYTHTLAGHTGGAAFIASHTV